MTDPARVLDAPAPVTEMCRFYVGDLTTHGPWIMERLLKAYPNQNQRSIIGWLNTVIDQNDYLCLLQANSVCFAERLCVDRLAAKTVVREIFVWCRDREDPAQVQEALAFYDRMADWARHQGVDKVIVCEKSDVPEAEVRKKFSRLHEIKTTFVRI